MSFTTGVHILHCDRCLHSADVAEAAACEVISSAAAKLQTEHQGAFMIITGDFNHALRDKTLNNFHQYVDCPTRENETLDLLYANAIDAYDATAHALGWWRRHCENHILGFLQCL